MVIDGLEVSTAARALLAVAPSRMVAYFELYWQEPPAAKAS